MSRTRRSETRRDPAGEAPSIVVDGFLPGRLATAMRSDIDAHFANPAAHRPETHQIWDYASSPEGDAWLRTAPERVIGRERVAAFHAALREWATRNLGMADVTWPVLSLFVGGGRQGWHTPSPAFRFTFLYSLTRNERRAIGGQALVMREGDPLRADGFYETIEPRFNRLAVFDARLPQAVERVAGAMDPTEGCFLLHGQLREGSAVVVGALAAAVVAGPLNEALARFAGDFAATVALYRGPLSFRLTIAASGAVEACDILVDRVLHLTPGDADWEPLRGSLVARLKALKFPAAAGRTVLIQPILFGTSAG